MPSGRHRQHTPPNTQIAFLFLRGHILLEDRLTNKLLLDDLYFSVWKLAIVYTLCCSRKMFLCQYLRLLLVHLQVARKSYDIPQKHRWCWILWSATDNIPDYPLSLLEDILNLSCTAFHSFGLLIGRLTMWPWKGGEKQSSVVAQFVHSLDFKGLVANHDHWMKMSNKTFNCFKVVKVDALQAKLKVMSSFCCRQGVYNTLQKPSYDFGIM